MSISYKINNGECVEIDNIIVVNDLYVDSKLRVL